VLTRAGVDDPQRGNKLSTLGFDASKNHGSNPSVFCGAWGGKAAFRFFFFTGGFLLPRRIYNVEQGKDGNRVFHALNNSR